MLAFTHIEKCGGTTVIEVLRREFLFNHCDVIPRDRSSMLFFPEDLEHLLRWRPRLRSISGHSVRCFTGLRSEVPGLKYYVTMRDPVRRYVSDYLHFTDRLGYRGTFEQWLRREDRHNFQTKAIVGCDDVELAKQRLEQDYALVGIVEQMPEFFQQLRSLAWSDSGVDLGEHYRVANMRWRKKKRPTGGLTPTSELIDTFQRQIHEVNACDMTLYSFVTKKILPAQKERFLDQFAAKQFRPRANGWLHSLRHRSRLAAYRLFRNAVYKPHIGYSPFQPHLLPVYREASKAA